MTTGATNPLLDPFLEAAGTVAAARPEVDLDLARELLGEAAAMLHNGLALDGLDEHDTDAVVAGLAAALTDRDPTDAVHAASRAALEDDTLHDRAAASASYLIAAAILRL